MKARINVMNTENINAIEFYYKSSNLGGTYLVDRDEQIKADENFYDFRTPTLKLKFESQEELESIINYLIKYKEYIKNEV